MHGPGTLLRRVPGYRKVTCLRHVSPQPMGCARVYPKSDVPPARTASANGLCERISDETVPPARTALASGLREKISDETVPPARTALASGLREKISDETEPPARTALANRLCERISEEIVPEARHSRVTRYATQERAGDRGYPYTNQRAGGTLLLHVQMFSLCRSNPNYRKRCSLQVAHVIHPHIRGQDDVLVVA